MKKLATFLGVCLTAAVVGCSSTQKSAAVSPGAIEGKACSQPCAQTCTKSSEASPGAVSGSKKDCSAQCPHAAKTGETVSPGAVGETTVKSSGCGKSKSGG